MSIEILLLSVVGLIVVSRLRQRASQISSAQAHELVGAGARLVDVRTPGEYADGHIEGAVNLPLQSLGARLEELEPPERPVVLYCRSGMRSASAKKLLQRAGFEQVNDLGSISRW